MSTLKENVSIWTAIAAFSIGWGLTIGGFFVEPMGEIADSVLWVLGQSLVYVGSVLGITQYFNSEQRKLRKDIRSYANRLSKGEPEITEEEIEEE